MRHWMRIPSRPRWDRRRWTAEHKPNRVYTVVVGSLQGEENRCKVTCFSPLNSLSKMKSIHDTWMRCWGFNEFEPASCTNNVCLKSNRILEVKQKSCFTSAFIIPHILFLYHIKKLSISLVLFLGKLSFILTDRAADRADISDTLKMSRSPRQLSEIFFCQQSHYSDSNAGAFNEGLSTPAVMKCTKALNVRNLPRPCREDEPRWCSLFAHLPRLREVHVDIKI